MSTSSSLILRLAAALLCLLLPSVAATDHIVGANKGWNPGANYTLWANNQTFYVGDLISFRYQKTQYNVFEVKQTGYDNCTIDSATGNWSSGKDFIPLNEAKRYYFICGTGGCFSGMTFLCSFKRFRRRRQLPLLGALRVLLLRRRRLLEDGTWLQLF